MVDVGAPVSASTRSGSRPSGVAARRRSAIRRSAARRSTRRRVGRPARRSLRPAPRATRRSRRSAPSTDPRRRASPRTGAARSGSGGRRRGAAASANGREKRRPCERPHRPRRRRVEPRVRIAGVAHQAAGDRERAQACAGSDRVAEIVAAIALLVVGAIAPPRAVRARPPPLPECGDPGSSGGCRDPPGGVPLRRTALDRPPRAIETRRGPEVEPAQELGDAACPRR